MLGEDRPQGLTWPFWAHHHSPGSSASLPKHLPSPTAICNLGCPSPSWIKTRRLSRRVPEKIAHSHGAVPLSSPPCSINRSCLHSRDGWVLACGLHRMSNPLTPQPRPFLHLPPSCPLQVSLKYQAIHLAHHPNPSSPSQPPATSLVCLFKADFYIWKFINFLWVPKCGSFVLILN